MQPTNDPNIPAVRGNVVPDDEPGSLALFAAGKTQEIGTLPADPFDAMELRQQATGPECLAGGDLIGETIEFTHWFCHAVELMSEDGEIINTVRSVLMILDGPTYQFASSGVAESLRQLYAHFGTKAFKSPIKAKIVQVKTRNWRILKLQYDVESLRANR